MKRLIYVIIAVLVSSFVWAQNIECTINERVQNDQYSLAINIDQDDINLEQVANNLTQILGPSKSEAHPIWVDTKGTNGKIVVKFLNGGVFLRAKTLDNNEEYKQRIDEVRAALGEVNFPVTCSR